MSTKNSMGVLLLVEVRPKPGFSEDWVRIYQDAVTAEFSAYANASSSDPTFPFEIVSVKEAVAP